jgi:sugar lactone lactonase YvrE
LHCFDLRTRTWKDPLREGREKYFWNLTIGSDGNVYGGTWPGCSLLRYDPVRHTLENLGRASDNAKNLYSRQVWGELPGTIFVQVGFDSVRLRAYSISSGTFADFGSPGFTIKEIAPDFICTENNGVYEFYDPRTFEPLPAEPYLSRLTDTDFRLPNGKKQRVLPLANGRYAGVRGQEYFIVGSLRDTPELKRIPVPAPATMIHTLIAGEDGKIWGSCAFGQTIFFYDPADGSYWNSPAVCDSGGEVYGMQFVGTRLFMSCYAGGDHVVYDTEKPWNQLGNENPRTLRSVAPALIRPTGRTVLGPDGGIWTGWSAKYGTYGGGLSRVDPHTLEVESWYDPVLEQQICGLTADGKYLYFTANGGASGLAYKEEPCHFGVWSVEERRVVFLHPFENGVHTGSAVLAAGGRVFVAAGNGIREFHPDTFSFTRNIELGEPCTWMVKAGGNAVAAFGSRHLYLISAGETNAKAIASLPDRVHAAAFTQTGELYFAIKSKLYRMDLHAAGKEE